MSTLNTTNIKHAGNTGDANLVLASDGTSTFNNDVTIDGDLSAAKGMFADTVKSGSHYRNSVGASPDDWKTSGGIELNANGTVQVSHSSAANLWQGFRKDTQEQTSSIGADGSAKFAGAKFAFETDGSANFYGQESASSFALLSLFSNYGSFEQRQFKVTADGNVYTKGNMSSPLAAFGDNIEIFLEADDPANYVSTMVDGEEQQVYNGPTLDVKEKLLDFVARIEALEAANASLEARLTALEGGN